jgi:hypothetical protein
MELKAIASLNTLAIMFSGLDQREEAFAAAAKATCMRPGSDFERTVMSAIPLILKDRIAARIDCNRQQIGCPYGF